MNDPEVPPHSLEAEIAVLGSLLLIPNAAEAQAVFDVVAHSDFYRTQHAGIFRCQQDLWETKQACDIVLLREEMREAGLLDDAGSSFVTSLLPQTPSAANAVWYARIVRRYALSRTALGATRAYEDEVRTSGNGTATAAFERLQRAKAAIEEFDHPTTKTPLERFVPIGAFDLIEKPLPPIEELVSPRIVYRGGVTLLVAAHKRGKSLASLTLSIDLVLNIAIPFEELQDPERCPKWLGQMCVGNGPVLVYSAEGGERMVKERLLKMVLRPGEHINDLKVYAGKPTPRLDSPADLDAVFAQAEVMGARLIVFDPLGRFWAMADEADPTAARNLMEAIQERAERAYDGRGIAVLLVHHDTKATGADEDAAVTGGRGSGKFGDDADALINLKVIKGAPAGQSKVMFLLRHAESPKPVTVMIDKDTLRLREMSPDEIEQAKPEPKKKGEGPRLTLPNLERLIRAKKQVKAQDVADLLGVAYGSWKNLRTAMLRDLTEGGEFEVVTKPGSKAEWICLVLPK